MQEYPVKVSGIAPTTTEAQLHDFFTFCGAITKIDFKGPEGVSTIYFVKPSAVSTALMLNGGTLDGASLTVTTESEPEEEMGGDSFFHHDKEPVTQADKPRAGIVAEYLAKGYELSDSILQRAIDVDNQKGISKRFVDYFHSLDQTVGSKTLGQDQTVTSKLQEQYQHAAEKARAFDEQKGLSKSAHDYYSKAISSPFGQRVKDFYTNTSKQIADIHEEAKRINDSHKAQHPGASAPSTGTPATPGSGHPTKPEPTEVEDE